jgi:hypothetical protein
MAGVLLPLLGPAAAAAAGAAAGPPGAPVATAQEGPGCGCDQRSNVQERGQRRQQGEADEQGPVAAGSAGAGPHHLEVPPAVAALLEAQGRQLAPGVLGQVIPDHTLMPAGARV